MSMSEKNKHARKSESKAHSIAHKHDSHKMANVVNHINYERHNGFESTKHKDKRTGL